VAESGLPSRGISTRLWRPVPMRFLVGDALMRQARCDGGPGAIDQRGDAPSGNFFC